MATALSIAEARTRILDAITPLGAERVLLDDALGRYLAEDIASPIDWPRFDNSAMDGFAVRWDDIAGLSEGGPEVELAVLETVTAGDTPDATVGPGQAVRIMTGAPTPQGADTVVMREDTRSASDARVVIAAAPSRGQGANIRRRGENFARDEVVLPLGQRIDAGAIGLLASFARSRVAVGRRPLVSIVSTGDELREIDEAIGDGQIVNSSSYMLAAQLREAGAIPRVLPIVRDTAEAVAAAFDTALAGADAVVSIGGVSVGDHDFVRDHIQARAKDDVGFWRVAMKPGKPLAFGRVDGVPLFGLPGNPVSSFVTFNQFVRPALRKMQGAPPAVLLPGRVEAFTTTPLKGPRGRQEAVRGRVVARGGRLEFTALGQQGSANLMSLVDVDALAFVGAGARLVPGDRVEVELTAAPRLAPC